MVLHSDCGNVRMSNLRYIRQVGEKYIITIPKKIRKPLGIEIGDPLEIKLSKDGHIELFKIKGAGNNGGNLE